MRVDPLMGGKIDIVVVPRGSQSWINWVKKYNAAARHNERRDVDEYLLTSKLVDSGCADLQSLLEEADGGPIRPIFGETTNEVTSATEHIYLLFDP